MNRRWVTVTAVAERLGISRVTARKRLVARKIPGWTLAFGMARVDRQVFEDWAKKQDPG